MKIYDTILFDWDGCLAQTLDIVLAAYRKIFTEYGLTPADKEITTQVFGDWDGPKKLGITDIDTYTTKLLHELDKTYPSATLYPDVKEVLLMLKKRNKKLALVTSSKLFTIQPALVNNEVQDIFDVILSAEDVTKHKPDPEIIDVAIDKLHSVKEKTIIIGDSKSDLGAAQNAGIDSILFYPEKHHLFYDLSLLQSYHPTYIIKEFKEILDIIQ